MNLLRYLLIILSSFMLSSYAQDKDILCTEANCLPAPGSSYSADIQEKAGYSAFDMGVAGENVNVTVSPNQVSKELRLNLRNGSFDGAKNLNIDLSSYVKEKVSPNLVVIGDNFETMILKLNGYNGQNGKDASQICYENIRDLKYGNDAYLKYLQNRANPANGLIADRCGAMDVQDLSDTKFSCNEPNYVDITNNQSIDVTRVRRVSKCTSVIPQPVCVQRAYNLTCNYEIFVKDQNVAYVPPASCSGFFCFNDPFVPNNYKLYNDGAFAWHLLSTYAGGPPGGSINGTVYKSSWSYNGNCSGSYTADRNSWTANYTLFSPTRMYDGVSQFSTGGQYLVDYQATETFTLSETELQSFYSQGQNTQDICQAKVAQVQKQIPNDIYLRIWRIKQEHNCGFNSCGCDNYNIRNASWGRNSMEWRTFSTSTVSVSSPGLDPTGLRLSQSSPAVPPSQNVSYKFTNPGGWQMEIMKGFAETCNPGYTQVSIESQNLVKFNDTLESCAGVQSCDSSNTGLGCTIDPDNLGTYTYIGLDPDPLERSETLTCTLGNCPVENQLLEDSRFLDSLSPTQGENGTQQGSGLIFIYDAQSINQQALAGQAGRGGNNDLLSPSTIRYCALKRDQTTDPNSSYKNNPVVTFKRINWKTFDIDGGELPGNVPPFTSKKVNVFKKLDPAVLNLLKKELL